MPSYTASAAASASSTSSSRRRCLRTSTTTTGARNNNNNSSNSSYNSLVDTSRSSLLLKHKKEKSKNANTNNNNNISIVSTGSNSSSCSSISRRWPPLVSPISASSAASTSASSPSHRHSSSSRRKISPPPAVTTTRTVSLSSPRSVVSTVSSFHSPPFATTNSRTQKNSSPMAKSRSSNNNSNKIHALHAAQTHSSLELTTVAEDFAGAGAWSHNSGSTASGDSFILPLDNHSLFDDQGFFLSQHPQQELESDCLLDDSFEDPYLLQKEQVRLRNKNNKNNKRPDDERDYFCTGSKSMATNTTNNHSQQRSTVDTECSTAAAAAAADDVSSSCALAVRYLTNEDTNSNVNKNHTTNIPPLPTHLHGLPPHKHFGETDQLSVPSQNEEHGGDDDDDDDVDFHIDYDAGQEQVEVQRVDGQQQLDDNNNNIMFAASLASIEVDDQQGILMSNSVSYRTATLQKTRAAQHAHALYFWNTRLTARIMTHGQLHFTTAQAWLELGNAHLEAKEYCAAYRAFSCAQRIIKTRYAASRPVALARALDRMGVACSKTARFVEQDTSFAKGLLTPEQTFQKAMDLLLEALRIRYQELGPWHVDTVDCLNHLAWVQYDAGLYDTARRSFWEVFFVRKAIFGSSHPGVAVAAHDLANCFFKLGQLDNADNFYSIALEIYDAMNVPMQNPAVARLLRDMKRLERLQKTF